MDNYHKFFKDKTILVTGGTGSIGSEIVRKLLKYPVRQVRVFSRDEHKQFYLEQEFKGLPIGKVTFLIGDVRDRERVNLAMERIDIVFNAAAMKHVHSCEYNPFEAIKTNVIGVQNLVDAARERNVEKFIHISTDKAAIPINVMGATKLLAEKIALSAEEYKGKHKTVFCSVRFGNVIGSRASVVPLFYEQIKKGGPVTLTDTKMTRFIMNTSQAVDLVFKAGSLAKGGELFILKMPAIRIYDLAKAMVDILAPKFGYKQSDIWIKITGKREGEKIYELLMTEEEADCVYKADDLFLIARKPLNGFKLTPVHNYRSDQVKLMDYEDIVKTVKNHYQEFKWR